VSSLTSGRKKRFVGSLRFCYFSAMTDQWVQSIRVASLLGHARPLKGKGNITV